jgi:hypothetical protein
LGRLVAACLLSNDVGVDAPLDRGEVLAIMTGLINANEKLDRLIEFFEIEDTNGEEEED